jgi:hypothetical protein
MNIIKWGQSLFSKALIMDKTKGDSFAACVGNGEILPQECTPKTPEVTQPMKQISEPVLSIIETMKEDGRWSVNYFKNSDPEYPVLTVIDRNTNTTFHLHPHPYDRFCTVLHNCDWVTTDEQYVLKSEIWRLHKDKQQEKRQQERQKMMEIYCVGGSNEN